MIFFINVDIQTGINRSFDKDGDKLESLSKRFYKIKQQGYLEISKLPTLKTKFKIIEGNRSIEDVHAQITEVVSK